MPKASHPYIIYVSRGALKTAETCNLASPGGSYITVDCVLLSLQTMRFRLVGALGTAVL